MADYTAQTVLVDNQRRYVVTLNGISDGTGETDATKVTLTDMYMAGAQAGAEQIVVGSLVVEGIEWAIQGYTAIRFFWDTPEQNEIAILSPGEGSLCFEDTGLIDPDKANADTFNPGNIVMTTTGHSAGDTYTITLRLRKKAA